jgi:hypothetical protein
LQSDEWRITVAGMERPIEVDLPHKLGKEEARRRIANNVHRLKDHIPGGAAHVQSVWAGDALSLDIHAMGQEVQAEITVQDTFVRCKVLLPGMLALFAPAIEAALSRKGSDVLLEDKSKKG